VQIIPVLDLLDRHAVRALRGERTRYRPIESILCATSEPLAVAHALLAATGSRVLYVADLGAILQQRDHADVLAALCRSLDETCPGTAIWLDGGYTGFASMRAMFERIERIWHPSPANTTCRTALVPVFGTESLCDAAAVREAQAAGLEPVLSLDHRAGHLLSTSGFITAEHASTQWWPSRVIAMTLDQVGAYEGPDLHTLAAIRERAADRTLIGAGGIRNSADLVAAAASGADAWLVASALHDRQLDALVLP
jgi:phosphoribosylformimino-5-aminoimidazole carboxamide ribotide isomerase